jgi:hypothetical protein
VLIMGRMDEQVKISGVRIELQEVEQVLQAHDLIKQAACVVHQGAIVAYVVQTEIKYATDELLEHCKARLAPAAVPKLIVPLHEMPVTANGKVDKPALSKEVVVDADDEEQLDKCARTTCLLAHGWLLGAAVFDYEGKQRFFVAGDNSDIGYMEPKHLSELRSYLHLKGISRIDELTQIVEIPPMLPYVEMGEMYEKKATKEFWRAFCRSRELGAYDTMFNMEGANEYGTICIIEVIQLGFYEVRRVPVKKVPPEFYEACKRWRKMIDDHEATVEEAKLKYPNQPKLWPRSIHDEPQGTGYDGLIYDRKKIPDEKPW